MSTPSGEVSTTHSEGTEECDVHDAEEYREQGGRGRRLAGATYECWIQVRYKI